MKVELYEKIWMALAVVLVLLFVGAILFSAYASNIHPPSHLETIDPLTVTQDPRFAEPGVRLTSDGGVEVVAIAQMWAFDPNEIHVPAGRPVTFRITSPDLIHGFQVVGTNVNVMVIPGYVSQIKTRFDRPGEYLLICNEYCGAGHHVMAGKIIVENKP